MKDEKDPLEEFFARFPRPRHVPRQQVARLLKQALDLFDKIPPSHLSSRQKKALSGYLFSEGLTLVLEVAEGLEEYRSCFPEIPTDPAELRDGLHCAGHWLSLREIGRTLMTLADEHYTFEKATQVRTALEILRHVRADRGKLYPGPKDKERARAMEHAEDTLAAYRQRVSRKAKKKK